jgi:DnaJ-class molecular chaperone
MSEKPCPSCNGTGSYYDLYDDLCECPMCDGSGRNEPEESDQPAPSLFEVACQAAKAQDVAIREGKEQ